MSAFTHAEDRPDPKGFIAIHYASVHLSPLSPIGSVSGKPELAVRWDDAFAVVYGGTD